MAGHQEATEPEHAIRKSLISLENSLVDAVTSDITESAVYVTTFLVGDRFVFILPLALSS